MSVSLPVRERAIRALVTHLEGITRANGYNTDVRRVRRNRDIIQVDAEDPPEIHLTFEESSTIPRGTEDRWTAVPVSLFFFQRHSGGQDDYYYNLFLADIIKRLQVDFFDTSNPSKSYHVQIESEWQDEPLYYEGQAGDIVGRIDIVMVYSWVYGDPFKWDSEDTVVTE